MSSIKQLEGDKEFCKWLSNKYWLPKKDKLSNCNFYFYKSNQLGKVGEVIYQQAYLKSNTLYYKINIYYNKKNYSMCWHRVKYFLHYNKFPDQYLDHINNKPNDNRIKNLRDVSASENNCNRKRLKSSTGFIGVSKHHNKYKSFIYYNKKSIYLGTFSTALNAALYRDWYIKNNNLDRKLNFI